MKRTKQLSFSPLTNSGEPDKRSTRWQKAHSFSKLTREGKFGGSIAYRCSQRPIDSKKALHIVLKSGACKGTFKFTNSLVRQRIENLIKAWAKKKHIPLYKIAIVSNHIHLLIRVKSRTHYNEFIRALSSDISSKMKKWARKLEFEIDQFWESRPFSRIIHFGQDFQKVLRYLSKNTLEALGFIPYSPRNHSLNKIVEKLVEQQSLRVYSTG